ncbi:hypothetical protein EVG20_g8918 [Dentipellis fragilis]|uniref:Phosphatidylinositol N-acetylglucosaminyltransferase subunit H conserved domain-containing protein n=1 Tax=Dentipellis fragilis TaxID=205917 RepID=A0A4Y9Y4W9_9AGAM|nr:hypothetical protein EVG20_g8918 [Dentipellis fragilis]
MEVAVAVAVPEFAMTDKHDGILGPLITKYHRRLSGMSSLSLTTINYILAFHYHPQEAEAAERRETILLSFSTKVMMFLQGDQVFYLRLLPGMGAQMSEEVFNFVAFGEWPCPGAVPDWTDDIPVVPNRSRWWMIRLISMQFFYKSPQGKPKRIMIKDQYVGDYKPNGDEGINVTVDSGSCNTWLPKGGTYIKDIFTQHSDDKSVPAHILEHYFNNGNMAQMWVRFTFKGIGTSTTSVVTSALTFLTGGYEPGKYEPSDSRIPTSAVECLVRDTRKAQSSYLIPPILGQLVCHSSVGHVTVPVVFKEARAKRFLQVFRNLCMQRTRPLPNTNPELLLIKSPGPSREYRVENRRLDYEGGVQGAFGLTRGDIGAITLATILWPLVFPHVIPCAIIGFVTTWLAYRKCTQILWESVLVIPRGIQLETHRGFPPYPLFASRNFIPLVAFQDLIINEGLRRWDIRYYIAVLQTSPDGTSKLQIAFENLLPRLPVLLEVYHDILDHLSKHVQ